MSDLAITSASAYNYRRSQPGAAIIVYVDPVGETGLEQFLVGRRTRPYNAWRPLVQQFLTDFLGLEGFKISWSQNAGCSTCPCSPGFRVLFDGKRRVPTDLAHQLGLFWTEVGISLSVEDLEYSAFLRDTVGQMRGDDSSAGASVDDLIDDIDALLAEVR